MQVACNSCGAQYEFEASAIPAEGYDAQCTSCSAIFFVAPERSAAAAPADAPQVSVSCSHCGAIYQFAASDIPAGGYDAQCTQCQGVFFVSPDAAGPTPPGTFEATTHPGMAYTTGQVPKAQVTTELPTETTNTNAKTFSPRPIDSGTMELSTAARPAPVVPAVEEEFDEVSGVMEITDTGVHEIPSRRDMADNSDDTDAIAPEYTADMGSPLRGWTSKAAVVAADIDQEDDPGTRGRSTPLFVAMGTVFLVTVVVSVGYKFGPAWLQRMRQPPLKPPSAQAQAAFERGEKSMLDDTEEGYQGANAAFVEAVNMAPDYIDALVWQAVANTFLGHDRLEAGRVAWHEAQNKQAEAKALAANAPQGHVRPREVAQFNARVQGLQREAQAAQQKAMELLESGGKTLSDGESHLLKARRLNGERPMIAEAQAIWYVNQPAGSAAAAQELLHAEALRNDFVQREAQPAPTPWFHVVTQARLDAALPATQNQAVATLQALVSKSPQVVRARWELADLLARIAQKNEARDVAQAILATVPNHTKAQGLLAALGTADKPAAAATDAAADETAAEGAAKPAKGKRRRAHHR